MNKFEQPKQENKIYGIVETQDGRPVYEITRRYNEFADIVIFRGVAYDCREQDSNTGWYRLTSEDYFNSPNPAYIRVDKKGNVIEAKTIRSQEWFPPEKNE